MKILQNQIRCKNCGDTPFSKSTHDFKYCKCGAVAVDGGLSYLRRVGDFQNSEELSIEVSDETYEKLNDALNWAKKTGRNNKGIISAIMRTLRDCGFDLKEEPQRRRVK